MEKQAIYYELLVLRCRRGQTDTLEELVRNWEGSVLKKSTINLKKDEMASAGLAWCFVVIIESIVLVYSGRHPDPITGVHMLVSLLFFLVMAAVFMIRAFVQRSQVNTREKPLEVEYRLAELAEKIENKPSE